MSSASMTAMGLEDERGGFQKDEVKHRGSYGHGKPGKVMEFFLIVISRPGKVLNCWESHGNLFYSYINLHSLIKGIKIDIHISSFNQNIVSHLCH